MGDFTFHFVCREGLFTRSVIGLFTRLFIFLLVHWLGVECLVLCVGGRLITRRVTFSSPFSGRFVMSPGSDFS